MEKRNELILFIGQRPVLSQEFQYSLKILEMNNLELAAHIEENILENPFLKREDNCRYSSLPADIEDKNRSDIYAQMAFLKATELEKEIAEIFIHDTCKGLTSELLKEISSEKRLNYFELLQIINKLKKTSLGEVLSFNLQDKLKTFLENSNCYNNDYAKFIRNIDLVFSDDWATLKERCAFDDDKLSRIMSGVKKAFKAVDFERHEYTLYKEPDLIMEEKAKNEYRARINETTMPNVSCDIELYNTCLKGGRSLTDINYMKEHLNSAKILIKSVNYRNSTLVKIAKEVIYRQQEFFCGEDLYPIPISIKSVADSLFLHESTVHRAICGKTVSTSRGILDFKELFPRKIKTANGNVTDCSIKEYVKDLINNEPGIRPYSDSDISYFLNIRGIDISRRTISKYRSNLDIPNSSKRRRKVKINNK